MLTRHGATMSPRMERLWRYIQEERGINLTDWSTDECVERAQAELRAGLAVLDARLAAAPGDRDLAHLLADYRTIMERRPHARTNEAMLKSERAALEARGLRPDEIADMIGGR